MIIGSLPWAPWLRKKLEAWAEGDPSKKIIAAPEKGNAMVPPCLIQPMEYESIAKKRIVSIINTFADFSYLGIFALSAMSIISSGYNPFIYFQF